MKKLVLLLSIGILSACTHGNCRSQKKIEPTANAGAVVSNEKNTNRVKVFKADGSLQCNQGKKISAVDMKKQLGGIETFSAVTQNDGMIRTMVCGSPTGMINIYEIDRKDIDSALALGFKEWLGE